MVLGPEGHNSRMPKRSGWPLAAGLAAGVALDALFGDPRPVIRWPRSAAPPRRSRPATTPTAAAAAPRTRPPACWPWPPPPRSCTAVREAGRPWQAAAAALAVLGRHRRPFATS